MFTLLTNAKTVLALKWLTANVKNGGKIMMLCLLLRFVFAVNVVQNPLSLAWNGLVRFKEPWAALDTAHFVVKELFQLTGSHGQRTGTRHPEADRKAQSGIEENQVYSSGNTTVSCGVSYC